MTNQNLEQSPIPTRTSERAIPGGLCETNATLDKSHYTRGMKNLQLGRSASVSPVKSNPFDFPAAFNYPKCLHISGMKDHGMTAQKMLVPILMALVAIGGCSATKYLKGGVYRDLDENLTIVSLTESPNKYLDKEIVFSVRYYKKGDLPCPLGDDYVNFIIADRVSYITLNKVWIKKDKAKILDSLKEMETIVMKARVFKIDREKDPNLQALEIVPE